MNQGIEGSVAIVTGGAQGIGAAITRRLVEAGAQVAVLDLNEPTPDQGHAQYFKVDVGETAAVKSAVDRVALELGRIDFLINNAGVGSQGTVEAADDDEWTRVLNVNLLGVARLTRSALPHLRKSPHPSIVNVGSVAALTGIVNRAVYSASKAAVHGLTLAMAADHLVEGIRVNAVAPGTTDTPWVGRLVAAADEPDLEMASLARRQPHGRLVTPDEIALAVAHLLDPRAGSTTGTVLVVDGGLSALRLPPPPAARSTPVDEED